MRQNVTLNKSYLSKELRPSECQLEMLSFGIILSQFISCLLTNEVPYNICLNCVDSYEILYTSYKDLKNSTISKCSNSFLQSDKVSLLNQFYSNSINQWTDGNCNSCFKSKDPSDGFQINNDTIYYKYLSENYKLCVKDKEDTNLTNTTCISCKHSFETINDYYDSITSNYSSGVCYDVVDSMKDIREHWGESLECPVNTSRTLHILGVIMIVLMLPFVLYLTGRLFCHGNHKTLMRQKRLASSYSYGCLESQPLVNPLEK